LVVVNVRSRRGANATSWLLTVSTTPDRVHDDLWLVDRHDVAGPLTDLLVLTPRLDLVATAATSRHLLVHR